ncbi:MAG TPA: hypothetical protein VEK15_24350 [Vicinamibacteria bacterium]|nr:hypothetical protein [Vicinamibacteria bacterium]
MTTPRFLYCWFDTEYTMLELERAEILQIALIVTGDDLSPLPQRPAEIPDELLRADGFSAVATLPPSERISDHVKENYQPLLESCRLHGRPVRELDGFLASYLDCFPESHAEDVRQRPVLSGNSIYADYFLARKYLPRFVSRLNYRHLDVTSFKIEWLFHYREQKFEKLGRADGIQKFYRGRDAVSGDKHDAYYDVQASIAELAFYRSRFERIP